MELKSEIPVGIVLYNPEIKRLKENLDAIYEFAAEIILIDNASCNCYEINLLISAYDKIVFIQNKKNIGIARALNQICRQALNDDFSYVLTLDQDTVCPENIFDKYQEYMSSSVGILCPKIKDRNYDSNLKFKDDTSEIRSCITSGSLVLLSAWYNVNGFDENMFIDNVDIDFCYRIQKKGYKIVCLNTVSILHEIGHIQMRKFLLWNVRIKNHNAFRKYYIARNTIYLARKCNSISLILKSYLQIVKQYICVLFYENKKKEKIKAISKGLIDGNKMEIDIRWS